MLYLVAGDRPGATDRADRDRDARRQNRTDARATIHPRSGAEGTHGGGGAGLLGGETQR